jgi:hypothetical protein
MRRVVDAGPILFGSNCVLKRFHITIVFGDREFDPRDVTQCRAGRSPARHPRVVETLFGSKKDLQTTSL